MINLLTASLLTLSFGLAHAEVPVADTALFGAKDDRGAYQEVQIKPFQITADYFKYWDSKSLISMGIIQNENDIWPDSDKTFKVWGKSMQLTFQDGELKTQNLDCKNYKQLDTNRTFAVVHATIAFDNKQQFESGIYSVSGTVTLVASSQFGITSVDKTGNTVKYQTGIVMQYVMSGAYDHPDCKTVCTSGGKFNEFGNGENDGGRIYSVGVIWADKNLPTIKQLKEAFGDLAQIVYP